MNQLTKLRVAALRKNDTNQLQFVQAEYDRVQAMLTTVEGTLHVKEDGSRMLMQEMNTMM